MDYSKTIKQFHTQLKRRGYSKENINNSFGVSDNLKLEYLLDLKKTFGYWSSVFFDEDGELDGLRNYIVPQSIVDFYKDYEPKNLPCLDGDVNLLSLEAIKRENSEMVPSAYLIKYGLLTFATTIGGNSVCFDLNKICDGEPRIVYVDKAWIRFDAKERQVKFSRKRNDVCIFSTDIVKRLPQIDVKFSQFMDKLSKSKYEDLESYYYEI